MQSTKPDRERGLEHTSENSTEYALKRQTRRTGDELLAWLSRLFKTFELVLTIDFDFGRPTVTFISKIVLFALVFRLRR